MSTDGRPPVKTSDCPGLLVAPSCVTHGSCNIPFFSAYLDGYKVSPALPAHHWVPGEETSLN